MWVNTLIKHRQLSLVTRLRPMPPRKRGSIPISEETLYILHSIQIKFGTQAIAGSEVDPATRFNPLALELDIYSLANHLCKM